MRIYASTLLVATLVLGITAGCSRDHRYDSLPELVPVTGTVTLDGKPLAKANLTFIPVGSTKGQTCRGLTDEKGRYEAMVTEDHKGLPVGEFRVVCNKWVMSDGSDLPAGTTAPPWEIGANELLPPRYSDETRTQLQATVPPAGGTIDFALKSGR